MRENHFVMGFSMSREGAASSAGARGAVAGAPERGVAGCGRPHPRCRPTKRALQRGSGLGYRAWTDGAEAVGETGEREQQA